MAFSSLTPLLNGEIPIDMVRIKLPSVFVDKLNFAKLRQLLAVYLRFSCHYHFEKGFAMRGFIKF